MIIGKFLLRKNNSHHPVGDYFSIPIFFHDVHPLLRAPSWRSRRRTCSSQVEYGYISMSPLGMHFFYLLPSSSFLLPWSQLDQPHSYPSVSVHPNHCFPVSPPCIPHLQRSRAGVWIVLMQALFGVELNHEMQSTAINPVTIWRRRLSKCWSGLLNEFSNWLSAERLSISCSFFFFFPSSVFTDIVRVAQLPFIIHSHTYSNHDNYLLQEHNTVFV